MSFLWSKSDSTSLEGCFHVPYCSIKEKKKQQKLILIGIGLTGFIKACNKEAPTLKHVYKPSFEQQASGAVCIFYPFFCFKSKWAFFGVYMEQCLLDSFHIRCHFMKLSFLFLATHTKAAVLMSTF